MARYERTPPRCRHRTRALRWTHPHEGVATHQHETDGWNRSYQLSALSLALAAVVVLQHHQWRSAVVLRKGGAGLRLVHSRLRDLCLH